MRTTIPQGLEGDFRAGQTYEALVDKYAISRSTIFRIAKEGGWSRDTVQRAEPPTREPHPPAPDDSSQVLPEDVEAAQQTPDALADTLGVLSKHARVAKDAADKAEEVIALAVRIIKQAEKKNDNSMIHAGGALLAKAVNAFEAANRIYRKNRGLDGVTRIEHSGNLAVTTDEARRALAGEFGFDTRSTTGDLASISVGVPDRSEPS